VIFSSDPHRSACMSSAFVIESKAGVFSRAQ
jgi:hypothetical protein